MGLTDVPALSCGMRARESTAEQHSARLNLPFITLAELLLKLLTQPLAQRLQSFFRGQFTSLTTEQSLQRRQVVR